MADVKISEMPAQSALTGDELIPAVDLTRALALQNRKVEIEQIVPKGGTTGQVLTKTSGTSYATQWSTPSGGGGDYNVLNIDFTATEVTANVSSPVVVSTYAMPANSLPATAQLLIESYVTFEQSGGDVANDFGSISLSHRLGITPICTRIVPISMGDGAYEFLGMLKIESRVQALNATNLQFNESRFYEFHSNFSDGAAGSVGMFMDGAFTPSINNVSTFDMTAIQNVELYAVPQGDGSVDSKMVHRFTRVSVIG